MTIYAKFDSELIHGMDLDDDSTHGWDEEATFGLNASDGDTVRQFILLEKDNRLIVNKEHDADDEEMTFDWKISDDDAVQRFILEVGGDEEENEDEEDISDDDAVQRFILEAEGEEEEDILDDDAVQRFILEGDANREVTYNSIGELLHNEHDGYEEEAEESLEFEEFQGISDHRIRRFLTKKQKLAVQGLRNKNV